MSSLFDLSHCTTFNAFLVYVDGFICLFHVSLVSEIEKKHGKSGSDEKHEVEPSVVEVKLEISQHRGDDSPVLGGHVHSHQDHHGREVHAHDLREEKHDYIRALRGGDPNEELGHGEEEPPCGAENKNSNHYKRNVLRPKLHVHINPEPVDGDVESFCDRIDLAHPVEHDIYRRYKNLPNAVNREEISEKVEIFALPRSGPVYPLPHILQIVSF